MYGHGAHGRCMQKKCALVTDANKWLVLWYILATLIVGLLIYLLGPVLTPFLIAALLAYMADPLADRLEAYKLSRTLSASIVFAAILLVLMLLILLFIPLLERQISIFIAEFPGYVEWLQNQVLPQVRDRLGLEETALRFDSLQQAISENWREAGGAMASLAGSVFRSGLTLVNWLINLVLIPVVTFYLLRDWDTLVGKVRQLLPVDIEPVVSRLAKESDEVLGAFLRGQLLVMLGLGTIYTVGLWIVGLDLALLIGVVAGLVSFVPYVGTFVGVLMGVVAAIAQFQDLSHLLPVLIVFGAAQLIESYLLTPRLVGERIGLHPVAVLFAVLAGGQLFGFLGVLLALPAAAVVGVLLGFLRERYMDSRLYDSHSGTNS